jgi:DNA primase
MSGIDYQALRMAISMEDVLRLLDYNPSYRRGEQLRGACPIHDPSARGEPRCFSVHLGRGLFRCFACAAGGNQLDLWRLVHRLPLYEAARKLCHEARVPIPLIPTPLNPKAEIRNSQPPTPRPATGELATPSSPKWPRF